LTKSLETSEWLLAVSLILILASLFTISHLHKGRKQSQWTHYFVRATEPFDITITGEVLHPGTFTALPGTRLGDLVKKSRPKRFANLRSLDLDRPIESSMEIVIAKLNEISIRVEGAVSEPVDLKLPTGSRIYDLKSKIQCSKDADPKFFKQRRLLKDKETLIIPAKAKGT